MTLILGDLEIPAAKPKRRRTSSGAVHKSKQRSLTPERLGGQAAPDSTCPETAGLKGVGPGKPSTCEGCPLAHSGKGFVRITLGSIEGLSAPLRLLIQGEAPGKTEAETGKAFQGDAGFWIRHNILRNAGVHDAEVAFDNTLRCLPPKNKSGEFYPVGKERIAAETRCRQYDSWDSFPTSIPLLLVGGKAMTQRLGVENVTDWHGHIESRNGRITGVTYHPAAVMRQPNLLPLVVREVSNLIEANANPAVLTRPVVTKQYLPDHVGDTVFDLEWHPVTNVLTVIGFAYSGDHAYSSYHVEEGLEILTRKLVGRDRLIGHNIIDADIPRIGIEPDSWKPDRIFDTMLAAHLVHAHFAQLGLLDLGSLVRFYHPTSTWKHDTSDLLQYNGYDCAYNFRLYEDLSRDLTITNQWHLMERQAKLANLAQKMHVRGVKMDRAGLESYYHEQREQRQVVKAALPVNPNSPKQVVKWANELGISIRDMKYETIVKHSGKHPDFDRLIAYREDSKSLKTWFPIHTDKKGNLIGIDEFAFPHFHTTGTEVDRFSCSDPNFQNLPPHLRRFIVPRDPDLEIVAFDYSQIENRTVAWLAGDTEALALWAKGFDPYKLTAALMFNVRYEDVTKEQRATAKVTELASLYGETEWNLAKRMFGSQKREYVQKARELQQKYFAGRPKVRAWQQGITNQLDRGDVTLRNPFGRVRFIYHRTSHERMKRGCHFLGCSTAAGIMNPRALECVEAIKHRVGELALPILIVHDEVAFELPKGDLETQRILREVLEAPMPELNGLVVPTKRKVGPNYGSLVED